MSQKQRWYSAQEGKQGRETYCSVQGRTCGVMWGDGGDASIPSGNRLAPNQVHHHTPRQASQAFLWVLLLKGF